MTAPSRSMRLRQWGGAPEPASRPRPIPQGTEVLVRVHACGMCHSDLHLQDGHVDFGTGRLSFADRIALPLTLGHETTGEVVALGPLAEGPPVGTNILVNFVVGCGIRRPCRSGEDHLCVAPAHLGIDRDGGYADHLVVPHPRNLLDLGGLDPVAAAPLACSGLTSFAALRKFGALLGDMPLVLIGAGGLGLMALHLLQMQGLPAPVVIERDAARRAAALAAGARAAPDPAEPDLPAQITAAVGEPPRMVLDMVGAAETADLALAILAKGGHLVVVGAHGGQIALPVARMASRALTIQGSLAGSPRDLRDLVALVRRHGLPPMPVLRRPLDKAADALRELRSGTVVGRIVLVP